MTSSGEFIQLGDIGAAVVLKTVVIDELNTSSPISLTLYTPSASNIFVVYHFRVSNERRDSEVRLRFKSGSTVIGEYFAGGPFDGVEGKPVVGKLILDNAGLPVFKGRVAGEAFVLDFGHGPLPGGAQPGTLEGWANFGEVRV